MPRTRTRRQAFGALFRVEVANVRNGLESDLISDREGVVSDTDEVTDGVCDSYQLVMKATSKQTFGCFM